MEDQYKELLMKLAEMQAQQVQDKKGEFQQAYKEFHDPVMTEANGRTDVERFWNMGRTQGNLADALGQNKIDPQLAEKLEANKLEKDLSAPMTPIQDWSSTKKNPNVEGQFTSNNMGAYYDDANTSPQQIKQQRFQELLKRLKGE